MALNRGFLRACAETLLRGMTGMRDPVPEEVLSAMQVYSEYVFDFLITRPC
jgi:hypothetical protein